MPVESVDPASWRQGLRKTGIVLVPSKGEKSMVRHFYVQECILVYNITSFVWVLVPKMHGLSPYSVLIFFPVSAS